MTKQDRLRDEIQDFIDDGLSRIFGTFVDSTTPGHLAHLLTPLVVAGVEAAEQAVQQAWDEGYKKGQADHCDYYPSAECDVSSHNPYRR